MKLVTALILALASVAFAIAADEPNSKTVDWDGIGTATKEMSTVISKGLEDIKKLVPDTNVEVRQKIDVISKATLKKAREVLSKMTKDILDRKLTTVQIITYSFEVVTDLQNAAETMTSPPSQLDSTLVQKIETIFETMYEDVVAKQIRIIELLAG